MAIIKKYAPLLNLSNYQTFLEDTNPNSNYFRITEFNNTLTGGKNGFLIEGTPHLQATSEIKIEVLDVAGNPVYFESGNGIPVDYYEGTSILVSIHVYDDTPIGIGKITILGELKTYVNDVGATVDVPVEWSGLYNVKWEHEFKINKLLLNEDKVRFYKRPNITIVELIKPIFTVVTPNITQTGSLVGIPITPTENTDLTNWSAGTLYKLHTVDDSFWTGSVDENIISVPSLNYSGTVRDVLNNRDVLVETPYTENNIVKTFTTASYTTTFEHIENQSFTASALTGSFANIKINQLKTFVGDVARVKVYRKSRNDVGDYQFIQDTRIESTELLKDVTIQNANDISYGNFTETNFPTYWITSSNAHPVSINNTELLNSLFIDYNVGVGGVQKVETVNTIAVANDVEYTLSFKLILNGTPDSSKTVKAYLSSSTYEQTFFDTVSSDSNLEITRVSKNIIATNDANAKLVFEFMGDDWYISDVSLRNSQETSFSPDEITLIQNVPRILPEETFDFKFEFYDINNNFIPVDVTSTYTFTGGNTSNASQLTKFLEFTTDTSTFRFSSGSSGNPVFQQIGFTITKNLLTGSTTYASSAFDDVGTYLTSASYAGGQYPGFLTNVTDDGATLTISNYTGSNSAVTVGSIIYSASVEDTTKFQTIYRFEDALGISSLLASSTSTNFYYEPTELVIRPSNQIIDFQVERLNLASNTTPITVNSGSGAPPLELVLDNGGKRVFQLQGSNYNYSVGSVTYEFTGSDSLANEYSDSVTITPLINFDAISVSLTKESVVFPSLSTGNASSNTYDTGDGAISVNVGFTPISFESGLSTNNRFDIIAVTGSGCTPNQINPSTNTYGISTLFNDSGSIELSLRYKAGNGITTDFQRIVTYSKAKNATPSVITFANPLSQVIQADSSGSGSTVPTSIEVSAIEGSTDVFTSIGTITTTGGITTTQSTNIVTVTSDASVMFANNGIINIPINYTDTEGTPGTQTLVATISKTLDGITGSGGIDAKVVKLSAATYVITYNAAGNTPAPSGTLIFSAFSQNFTNAYFKFTTNSAETPNETSYTPGMGSNFDQFSVTIPTTYFISPINVRVGVADGNQTELAFDTVTLLAIKPGTSGDSSEFYYIKPINGTQLKNNQGTLNLPKTISLKDASLNVLDTITLLDVTDGVAGGNIISSTLNTTRVNTNTKDNPSWSYSPTVLNVTGSFYGTDNINYTSDLILTPNYVNPLDYYKYNIGTSDPNITVIVDDGDGNILTENIAIATKDVQVTYTFTDPQTNVITKTHETFYIVSDGQDGYDAITSILTNDSHTIPTDNNGNNGNYAGSGTEIHIYEGTTELSYDGVGTVNGTWNISLTPTNISNGSIIDSGDFVTISNQSNMMSDVASILYEISGSRAGGDLFNISKIQTFSKSKLGASGSNGNNARAVSLTSDKYVVNYDGDDNLVAGQSILLTATAQNFTTPYYEFRSGSSVVQSYSPTATHTPINSSQYPISNTADNWTVNVKENGSGAVLAFDNIDLNGIREGSDAFTVFLTNDSHTFSAPVSGFSGIQYTNGSFEIRVFRGNIQYTYAVSGTNTYSIGTVTTSGISTSQSTVSSQRKFTQSALTADTGNVVVNIIDNTTGTTFSKTFTFGVSRTGATGSNGSNGTNGTNGTDAKKSTTGYVYYQLAALTQPSTPSATSYTFSTFSFSGLTAKWSKTPPIATGDSKYWVSVYNVTETTALGNIGIPTFTAASNSLQFTDIATFSALSGSNTTVINGDNITTGVLKSANYIFDNASNFAATGSVFTLTDGTISTPVFYSNNNNAGFIGSISASSGNIGSWDFNSNTLSSAFNRISLDASNESIIVRDSNDAIKLSINTDTILPDPTIGEIHDKSVVVSNVIHTSYFFNGARYFINADANQYIYYDTPAVLAGSTTLYSAVWDIPSLIFNAASPSGGFTNIGLTLEIRTASYI